MAVLSGTEILRMVRSGRLKIEPFSEDQVGAGSVDLHLGNEIRVFKKIKGVFHVRDGGEFARVTRVVRIESGGEILIKPGELIHGITREKVTLPPDLAAFIEGRSSLARIGLLTHLSSGFIHPGTSNRTVLEIANISPIPLSVSPGIRICQLIFLEVKGKTRYAGRFSRQLRP